MCLLVFLAARGIVALASLLTRLAERRRRPPKPPADEWVLAA